MIREIKNFKVTMLLVAMLSIIIPLSAIGQTISLREVRDMARTAKVMQVTDDLVIEGYMVGQPYGQNNEMNISIRYSQLRNFDLATGYIESLSGDVGMRINFAQRPMAKKFPRYAKVTISLKGTTLSCDEPGRVTINGLTDKHLLSLTQCTASELPRKEKYIGELTDDDIYTYVTLKDCEILFKDGAYLNVYEPYMLESSINKKVGTNKSMDCWATLICDKNGGSIYSLTNSLCTWRRNGLGVPQGSGNMLGIVSCATHPRYGGDVFGKYIIRPVDGDDYAMDWNASSSKYNSIAEWHWNDNKKEFATESGVKATIHTESVLADIGNGTVRLGVKGEAVRGRDTNNPRVDTGKEDGTIGFGGLVQYGALSIKTEAHNWWDWKKDCGKGVEVTFSTKGLTGENLLFGFTFAAGEISAKTSYGFPVFWNVEYSTDGKTWQAVEGCEPKKLRSLPWHWDQNVHGIHYDSVMAGAGYTEHLVVLPKSLFGQSKVYVRVVPVAKNAATLGYDHADNGALRYNSKDMTVVNFGSFVVRYN